MTATIADLERAGLWVDCVVEDVAHTLRSRPPLTPAPPTLALSDVRRANAVRERLMLALRTADTFAALRTAVAVLAADMQDASLDPEPDEHAAPTQRDMLCTQQWDQAPSTDRRSEAGQEYGEGAPTADHATEGL